MPGAIEQINKVFDELNNLRKILHSYVRGLDLLPLFYEIVHGCFHQKAVCSITNLTLNMLHGHSMLWAPGYRASNMWVSFYC